MPRKTEPLSEMIFIRLTKSDVEQLEAVEALAPTFPRAMLARQALRLGLKMIAKDVAILVNCEKRPKSKKG